MKDERDDDKRTWLFEVMGSLPGEEGRQWRQNITVHVVTNSAPRALELFAEKYPDGKVDKVERRNRTAAVIVDPLVAS